MGAYLYIYYISPQYVEDKEDLIIGNDADATANLTFAIDIPHGWDLQWDYQYGGNGHAQFAQPVGDIDEDGVNEVDK